MLTNKMIYTKYVYCSWRADFLVANFGYTYERAYRVAEQEWDMQIR